MSETFLVAFGVLLDTLVTRSVLVPALAADLGNRIAAMFRGEHINATEDRAVLHTALRAPAGTELTVDGQDVAADVHEVLGQMREFASQLRSGEWVVA